VFITLSLLLAAAGVVPGLAKVLGQPRMRNAAGDFSIPWRCYQLIGVAELTAVGGVRAGRWWHALGLAAAGGMAVLLIGPLASHRRTDTVKEATPALVALAIATADIAVAAHV
jgi:hypothetical protein